MTGFARKIFIVMFAAASFTGGALPGLNISSADAAPVVRDHRSGPVVRDHRAGAPIVRDHRGGNSSGGGVVVTSSSRDRGCSVRRCPNREHAGQKCTKGPNGRYKCPW